ncbi:mucin-binding protein [Ligilactobacillus hayakitensis]|nr:YSIRK-type signal peptide-containing protein [Ligilactobacillus hayakitensis]
MLSKNNLKYLHTKLEPRKQRFTIKKFNVGVASVLIGTTFALFAGQQQVSADDVTTNQVATTPNPTTSGTTENDTSQPTTTSSQTTPQLTYGTDGEVSAVPKIDDSNAKGAGTLSEDGLSITTKDGQKLTLSSNTIGGGSNNTESSKTGISLTYSGTGKTGDKVTIIIPKGTPYKISGFPTDPNNKHTVSNVDSADGLYNVQTATYISDDSDSYSATEYFAPIKETSIGDVPNLATDVGNTEKFIQFYFNDVYQGSLKVNQLMKPTLSPVLKRLLPGTNNDVKVKPNTLLLYALNVNEDPNYVANQNTTVPQIIKNINYGTTITIPVPTGFKLDLEKTNTYNTRYKGQYDKQNNFTITQQNPGDDIIITVPKDNGAETSGSNPYVIAGSYVQNVSQETSLKTDKQITIIQKINDNGDTITGSTSSFSNTLVPEDTNLTPAGSVEVIADGYKGWFTPEYSNFAFKSGQTESDHMAIGYYGFKTTLNTPITNATITLQFTELGKDSGKAYSEIDQVKVPNPSDTLPNLNGYTYQVTYTDGTTNQGSINSGGTFIAESGKYIKSISFTPNELSLSYTDNYNLLNNNQPGMNDVATKNMFVAYGKFKNTDDTGTNQTVTSQISVTIPNLNGSDKQVVNTAVIEQQVTSRAALKLNTYGQNLTNTDKTIPSNKQNNVYVVLSKDDSKYVTKEYEPIFYYVLPKGSYYSGVNTDAMPGYNTETTRPKITTTMVDGQQVVKIDYTGTKYIFENSQRAQAWIYAKTYPDAPNYTDVTGSIYINPGKMVNDDGSISDRLVKLDGKSLATTPFIPDDNNIYKIQDFTWRYEASGGKSVQTLATGNTAGEDSVVSAHSDTKGSTDMTYYFSTMNYVSPQQEDADIKDTYIILNLPQESDTTFQFTLKDPKTLNGEEPVKYVGSDNSLEFTYKYSEQTQPLNDWKAITGIPAGLTDSYVTADKVKDWSKIKSVMVSIPLIKKNIPVGRFKILGQDLTLAQDAGKTGSIEGEGFAAAFQPFTPGTPATITVTGQATIHARYHYVDANGTDQYLDLPDKVYQENKDTLNSDDFINAANQAKIPAGYELVGTTGNPTWTNGGTTWQADGTNDTAAFGQVAKYYMNGDTVTFELQHKIKEVTVTDNIKPNTPIAENPSVNYPVGIDNLQKQPTFTVNVTVDGNRDDTLSKVQPLTFTRSAFVDEVTGKLVDTPAHPNGYSAWSPKDGTTWNQVELPVKQGYFRTMTLPDDVTKASPTIILAENFDQITADHPDTTVNVTYTKLGHIQPVDENGNPLSAALKGYATPQYENDASDPEKAILPALPQINGYTAYLNDQPVSATNAYSLPQDLSQNLNVTYKKDDQHLKIQVLDINDDVNGAGVPIALTQDILTTIKATADMIGKSGDAVDKDELQANLTKIKDYFEDQGYKLYAQSPVIDTFDFDTKQDQSVTLKLIHDTEAQIQTKDITRTINYLDESGKTIQSTQTDKLTLVRYQVKDKVNHDVLGYTQDPSNKDSNGLIATPFNEANANDAYVSQTFDARTTPDLKSNGYDLDRIKHDGTTVDEIPRTTVDGNSTDMTYDVIYTPHIITVTKDTNVQPGQPIDNTGYVYPQNSQFDASQLQGIAKRVINFKYENQTQASTPIQQVINFERQGTLNLVTGEVIPDSNWTVSNDFAEVSAPEIPGYTPSQATVAKEILTQPQADSVVNITYTANPQRAEIQFIDDTTQNDLVPITENGTSEGIISTANTTAKLAEYLATGYEVVSDNFTDSTKKYDRDDNQVQQYAVHLKHKTVTVNPGDNKKTSDKLPDNSNLNYPDSVTEDKLHAQSKRTINFESTDNKLTIQPVIQTINYRRTATIDEVTGDVTYANWDTEGQNQWSSYQVPVEEGYFANVSAVNQVDNIEANHNETVTVTYKPLGYVVAVNEKGEALPVSPVQYKNNSSDATQMAITYAPEIPGYTVKPNAQIQIDETGKNKVNPTDLAQDTKVTYIANPQVINYTVIDDTTGQISVQDVKLLDGVTDQEITSENQTSYKDVLDNLAKQGYKVISNDNLPGKFGSTKTTLEIHVVHDTELTPETKTVTRTIEFIDKQSNAPISQSVKQAVTLQRYQVKDKVTNTLLGYATKDDVLDSNGVKTFTQSVADGDKAYVVKGTPTEFENYSVLDLTKFGYESGMDENDQPLTTILNKAVDGTTNDETIKVYYNQHVITVDYDTPKTGNVGSTNYVYPTNSNFDASELTKTTSRTINYVYGKDTVKPGSTGDATVKQTIEYRRTARLNLVTGEFTPNDDWKAYKSLTNNIEEADATKFAAIDSPKHDGYTPNQLTVEATNQAKDITVIYTANPAKAIVSFNDVTDDNQKVTDTLLTGITDGKLDHHKVDDQLKELEKQGYKLAQDGNHFDNNATAQTFDTQSDQDTISQQYVIDLEHVISDVITHTTIPAAGTKIDGTDVTYPKIGKLSMTVTRTIHYVYNEGKKAFDDVVQSITYTRTARVDAVKAYKNQPDAVTYTAWVPENEDSFSALDDKPITGYTADKQVDTAKVLFVDETPQNAEVTVTYSPDYQVAQFKFIDIDDNNAEIMNQLIEGQTAEPINFDTTKVIDALKKKGYVLVDDEYQTANKVFDDTNNSNQTDANPQIFKISMKHKIIEVANTGKTFTDKLPDNLDMNYPSGVSKDDLNKTVTRVIRVNDGAKTIVANQPVTFTRTAFVDEVTGQIKEVLDWQNQAGTNWPEYTVEPKLGYTPKAIDEKGNPIPIVNGKIAAKDVDANTSSQNIEISYVPQKQELTFAVIDNQNPENPISLLEVDYLDLQGLSDEKIDSANVQAKIDELKQALSKKGYVFEKQDEIPVAFDNDPMQAQTIKLYFKHLQVVIDDVPNQEQSIPTTDLKYPTVDALNKTVSRNISSEFTNKSGEPFTTITQAIELSRQANIDVVTQEVTYTDWQPAQGNGMFNSYVVPTISGYTPSVAEITEERALENGQPRDDERIVVSYRPNKREIEINYIDAITKQKLADSKLLGQTDQTVALNYENPLPSKYVLDDTDLVKQITIRGDKDPIITVPLSHKVQTKTIVVPIIRVITVIKPDGTKENISQSVSVEKTIVTDLVTNKVIKNTSSSAVLPNYVVPTILGYTPNMNAVDQLMVQSESTVKPVEISYTANPQKTAIKFVDDDNNETVIHQTDLVGKTDQQVALAIVNPDASKYEVVKTYPTTYTFKADNNEPVIIHLKHKTQEDKEFKTVTRKIILQIPGKADEVKIDQVKLSRSIVKDIVTGEVKSKSDWTSSQFTGFDAPEIKGMTPNIQKVAEQTITDMSADSEVRIVYTPINVAINYSVIDAKTHQVIKPTQKLGESSLNQVVPEILVAKYQHVLDQLRNAGYVIASYDSLPEVIEDGVNTLNISVSKPEPIEVIPTNPTTSNTEGTEAKEPDANVKPGPNKVTPDASVKPEPNKVETDANVKPGPNKVTPDASVKPEPNKVETDANVKPEPNKVGADANVKPGPNKVTPDANVKPGPNKVEADANVKPGPNKVEADANVNAQPNKVTPGKPTNVVPNNPVTTNTFDTEVKVPNSIEESNPSKAESVKPEPINVITVDPVTQNTGDTEIKVLDTFAETSSKEETKPEISFHKIHAIHEENRMLPQTGDDSSAVVSEIMGIFVICLGLTMGINLESKRKKK